MNGEVKDPLLVIGIGNDFRCDDGVGLVVARKLKEKLGWNAEVIETEGEGADLMAQWQGRETVFVIDAVSSGSLPGTLHWVDATTGSIPSQLRTFSSHRFGLPEAIEVARSLGLMPERLFVCGIEGANFSYGTDLSQQTSDAVGNAVERVLREVEASFAAAL